VVFYFLKPELYLKKDTIRPCRGLISINRGCEPTVNWGK
jgi:hypothetical protein